MNIYSVSFSTGNKCMYFVQIFEFNGVSILRILNSAFSSTYNYEFTFDDIVFRFSYSGSLFIPNNCVGFKLKDNTYILNIETNSLGEFKAFIIENISGFLVDDYINLIDSFLSGNFPNNPPSFMKVEEVMC